ncbi:MAG TPA: hypothetical protein VEI95_18600, partial [Acidobacteriota bacterium]|nr:hypothetical protein [Acidobacteriota bacterium]
MPACAGMTKQAKNSRTYLVQLALLSKWLQLEDKMPRSLNKSLRLALILIAALAFAPSTLLAADTLQSLLAGAKTEDEITFIAGAQTFGGRKGLADLEAAFNKRFSLKTKINFAA